MKRICAVLLILAVLAPVARLARGFSSVAAHVDNHRDVTRDAIAGLGGSCPDILRFQGGTFDGIVDGSATEAAHTDPVTRVETWAAGHAAWEREARQLYERGEFSDAYEKIGYVIHLVEDDFSPPHRFVVYHGPVQLDGYEYFTAPGYFGKIPRTNPGFGNLAAAPHPFTLADYTKLQARPGILVSSGEFVNFAAGRPFWLTDAQDDDDRDGTTTDLRDSTDPDFDAPSGWVDAY